MADVVTGKLDVRAAARHLPAEDLPEEAEAEVPAKVSAPIGPMVQLDYSGKNAVVIDRVYSIGPGVNSMPLSVWKKFSEHPNLLKLIKDGSLKVVSVPPDAPAAK